MITVVSDTIFYRPDGSISSVMRTNLESFTTPSGKETSEQTTATIDIAEISAHVGGAAVTLEARIQELEGIIADHQKAAADAVAEVTAAKSELAEAKGVLAAVAAADAQWDQGIRGAVAAVLAK